MLNALIEKTRALVERLEKISPHPALLLLVPLFVGMARIFLEWLVGADPLKVPSWYPLYCADYVTFYIAMFVLFAVAQKLLLKKTALAPLLIGLLLGLLPPFLDLAIGAAPNYKYFTSYPGAGALFFISPEASLGETIILWAVVIGFGAYAAISKRNASFFVYGALAAALALHINGGLMPILAKAAGDLFGMHFLALFSVSRAALCLAAIAHLDSGFWKMLKYRITRIFLVFALCIFAARLFSAPADFVLPLIAANTLAYVIALMMNAEDDKVEDMENLRETHEFSVLAKICAVAMLAFLLAVLQALGMGWSYIPLLIVGLSAIYSRTIRLKKTFPFAYLIEGAFFSLVFISFASHLPLAMPVLLRAGACFATFAIGSAVKDFKDEEGDRKARIETPFTMLEGERKRIFWEVFRWILVAGPPFFLWAVAGQSMGQFITDGVFMALAAYLLFWSNVGKSQLVDGYIALLSFLLLSGIFF